MTDLDDLIARPADLCEQMEILIARFSDQFSPAEKRETAAILARLVSLRDAEKELPGEPESWMMVEYLVDGEQRKPCHLRVVSKLSYDALHDKAVALQASLDMLHGAKFSDRCYTALKSRAESAESRVRALEAEREAMMARLREPTEEMIQAGCTAHSETFLFAPKDTASFGDGICAAFKAMTAIVTKGAP